jgi:hypothetical protein
MIQIIKQWLGTITGAESTVPVMGTRPRSPQWAGVRAAHLKKQKACQGCGQRDQLEVHHIIPYHIQPDRELDPANLMTLCQDCHLTWGHLRNWSSWNVMVEKDVSWYYLRVRNRP